jgi:hypothetical protein
MILFTIAERLHQPLDVVMSWDFPTISGWVAYFKIRDRENR